MKGTEEGWEIRAHSLVNFSALPLGGGDVKVCTTDDDLFMRHEMICTEKDIAVSVAKISLPTLGRLYTIVFYRTLNSFPSSLSLCS